MLRKLLPSALLLLAPLWLPAPLEAQDRKAKVLNDKAEVEADGYWIYNDLPRGLAEAQKTGKPLLVVFRCLPCEACAQLDADVVERDPLVRLLLDQFVCVRIVQANGLDLSLFEIQVGNQDRSVQGLMMYQYTGGSFVGSGPPRTGGGSAGRNILPAGVYPVADGYVQFFTLAPHWDRICRVIERPDLIDDPFFTAPENFSGNAEAKAMFDAILIEWCVQHTKREVMERSQAEGYMCGAINTVEDVFNDPHLQARGFFTEIDHPYTGPLKYPGAQFKMSETPWRAGRSPLLGEHTEEVLTGLLAYGEAEMAALREQGVLG